MFLIRYAPARTREPCAQVARWWRARRVRICARIICKFYQIMTWFWADFVVKSSACPRRQDCEMQAWSLHLSRLLYFSRKYLVWANCDEITLSNKANAEVLAIVAQDRRGCVVCRSYFAPVVPSIFLMSRRLFITVTESTTVVPVVIVPVGQYSLVWLNNFVVYHFTTSLYLQVLVASSSSVASQRHKQVVRDVWSTSSFSLRPIGVGFVCSLQSLQATVEQ